MKQARTKVIKISLETAKILDALRGEPSLTYDQVINVLLHAKYLLRLLAADPKKKEEYAKDTPDEI